MSKTLSFRLFAFFQFVRHPKCCWYMVTVQINCPIKRGISHTARCAYLNNQEYLTRLSSDVSYDFTDSFLIRDFSRSSFDSERSVWSLCTSFFKRSFSVFCCSNNWNVTLPADEDSLVNIANEDTSKTSRSSIQRWHLKLTCAEPINQSYHPFLSTNRPIRAPAVLTFT